MNQNQTESKPPSVEESREEGLDETTCSRSCLVYGCQNRTDQGTFVGDLCKPCHDYLESGKIGPTTSFLGHLSRELGEARSAAEMWRDRSYVYGAGEYKPFDKRLALPWESSENAQVEGLADSATPHHQKGN